MVNEHKSYPSIVIWVIYNEGWGQITDYHPEYAMTDRVRELDPTRLIDSVTGWHDHGAGDFLGEAPVSDTNSSTEHQMLTAPARQPPLRRAAMRNPLALATQRAARPQPHRVPRRVRRHRPAPSKREVSTTLPLSLSPAHFLPIPQTQITTNTSPPFPQNSLWPIPGAVNSINETYEIHAGIESYHYRAHLLLELLRQQVERYACSGAVYTQTTDVEGEVNGLLTYDRRVVRVDVEAWRRDIKALYEEAGKRV
jgi:hypothetical protein